MDTDKKQSANRVEVIGALSELAAVRLAWRRCLHAHGYLPNSTSSKYYVVAQQSRRNEKPYYFIQMWGAYGKEPRHLYGSYDVEDLLAKGIAVVALEESTSGGRN